MISIIVRDYEGRESVACVHTNQICPKTPNRATWTTSTSKAIQWRGPKLGSKYIKEEPTVGCVTCSQQMTRRIQCPTGKAQNQQASATAEAPVDAPTSRALEGQAGRSSARPVGAPRHDAALGRRARCATAQGAGVMSRASEQRGGMRAIQAEDRHKQGAHCSSLQIGA